MLSLLGGNMNQLIFIKPFNEDRYLGIWIANDKPIDEQIKDIFETNTFLNYKVVVDHRYTHYTLDELSIEINEDVWNITNTIPNTVKVVMFYGELDFPNYKSNFIFAILPNKSNWHKKVIPALTRWCKTKNNKFKISNVYAEGYDLETARLFFYNDLIGYSENKRYWVKYDVESNEFTQIVV